MEDILLYLSLKYDGNFEKIYKAIMNKEEINQEELDDYKQKMKCKYTTLVSANYPEALKSIACPPFVIYYYGDLNLVGQKIVGVVGADDLSSYGKEKTEYFVKGLVENDYLIVNGMAKGSDEVSINQVIESNGKCIAVLPCGIDRCYPKAHQELYEELKRNHLIMSEYPLDLKPEKWYVPARNRIVAGLSQALLVTEIKIKSSNMLTIGYALEQEKDVMSVPSMITSGNNGCNDLIENGAYICNSLEDLFKRLDNQENVEESEEDQVIG